MVNLGSASTSESEEEDPAKELEKEGSEVGEKTGECGVQKPRGRKEGGNKRCTVLKSSREGQKNGQWLSNVGTLGAMKGTGSEWWCMEAWME